MMNDVLLSPASVKIMNALESPRDPLHIKNRKNTYACHGAFYFFKGSWFTQNHCESCNYIINGFN